MNINNKPWSFKNTKEILKIQTKIWSTCINEIVLICKTPDKDVCIFCYDTLLNYLKLRYKNKGNYHLVDFYKLIY